MKKLGPLLLTRGPHFCSLKCGSLFLSLQIPSFAHSEFWTSLKSYPWYWVFDIIFVAKCCFVQGSCAGAVPATRSRSKKDCQYCPVSQAKPSSGTIAFIVSLFGLFWGKRPFLTKPHWCSACYHGTLGQPTLPGEQGSQAKPGVRHYCVHRSLQQTPPHPQADPYRYLSENHMDSNMLYTPNCIGICKVCSLNSKDLWLRPRSPLRRWGAVKNIFGKPQFSWPIYSLVVFRCFQWNSRTFIW